MLPRQGAFGPGYFAGVIALAAGYFLANRLGLALTHPIEPLPLVWPATGIAVAVLLRFGLRLWPGVLLGGLAAAAAALPSWPAAGLAAGVAAGGTLAIVAAVAAARRVGLDPAFRSPRDLALFAALAAAVGALTAADGVLWLVLSDALPWHHAGQTWRLWALGDAVGVLLFAPPVLAFTPEPRGTSRRSEAIGLGLALAACLWLAILCLGPVPADSARKLTLLAFPPILVLWVAARYRLWAGSVCAVILAAVAVWATTTGRGPFVGLDAGGGLLKLNGYLGGVALGVLGIAAATARRDREAAGLAEREALYRSLVEDNAAMVCRLGPDGRVVFANAAYLKEYRAAGADPVGRPFADPYQRDDRHRLTEALRALRPGGPPVCVEVFAPGGRMRWHKWTLRALGAEGGPAAGFQAVGLDVTDHRRAEQERRALDAQLFQTQKLESLGVLAGGIAHDFNNILTGILGHAELAAEEVGQESEVRAHLVRIGDAARRAAERVRQLMAYAGKGPMAVRPVDVNALVKDTAELVAVSIPKRCAVRFDPAPDLPPVVADDGQLRQVVTHLLINAAEAIGERAGQIHVRTEGVDLAAGGESSSGSGSASRTVLAPGQYVAIRVADTGHGMDETTKARVFDPFFSTKFAGRGLGLAAVHGIVRAHRGAVEVESAPEKGSEFTVLLPAEPAAEFDTAVSNLTPTAVSSPLPVEQQAEQRR